MWVFLNDAMLSTVAHLDKPDMLLVRARRREDLERHFPEIAPISIPNSDYPWRIEVPRKAFAQTLAKLAETIDYGNFKDSVQEQDRHAAYLEVWALMAKRLER